MWLGRSITSNLATTSAAVPSVTDHVIDGHGEVTADDVVILLVYFLHL